METNSKIFENNDEKNSKKKEIKKDNDALEKSSSDFQTISQDPANVLSFGGDIEKSKKKDKKP